MVSKISVSYILFDLLKLKWHIHNQTYDKFINLIIFDCFLHLRETWGHKKYYVVNTPFLKQLDACLHTF